MTFQVGGYQAVQLLGHGDAARVWRAERVTTGQVAVLTLFEPHQAGQLDRQIEVSATLRHQHLLPVLDRAESPDQLAMVTEFLTRGSLGDRLARGLLRPGQTVTVLAALAAALSAAHDASIVHGNVCAADVLFTADGRPVLAEIGAITAAIEAGAPPHYQPGGVSFEIARGAHPRPADDVFALGSLALQCLTGQPAWRAKDLRDVVIQSAFGQWPTAVDAVPPGVLAELITAMLDRHADRRPTMTEVLAALRSCDPAEPLDFPTGSPADTEALTSSVDPLPTVARQPQHGDTTARRPRGRHSRADNVDGTAGSAVLPGDRAAGDVAGIEWIEVDTLPSWSPSARVGPTDTDAVRVRRGPRSRLVNTLLTLAATLALAAAAVGAGLWWADFAEPTVSTLTDVTGEPTPSTLSTGASAASSPATGAVGVSAESSPRTADQEPDWTAVMRLLDQRRAAAFSTADASRLAGVYAADAPALAVDTERIITLAAAAYRIDGLEHTIGSVTVTDTTAAGEWILAVTDSMPSYPITDAAGAVVGHTAEQPATRRLVTLIPVGSEYRITAISGPQS